MFSKPQKMQITANFDVDFLLYMYMIGKLQKGR